MAEGGRQKEGMAPAGKGVGWGWFGSATALCLLPEADLGGIHMGTVTHIGMEPGWGGASEAEESGCGAKMGMTCVRTSEAGIGGEIACTRKDHGVREDVAQRSRPST